jgi:hypothetical protein
MNKEKQEDRGQKVNGDIDKMVTKHIIFAKIVVEGKSKTRYRSVNPSTPIIAGEKCLFDGLPANSLKVKWLVLKDVNFIIEMP